ncbi:uncharacterized protein LOC122256030 isoform X2 [Penaeus japonicus]|uniref:uncharacterized protein LOC122256030 isoform X2 n=1 Tax=Penaeus japonicus TaxID=27405 RepID=UPI001C70F81A|nr:uncharacterized protein LOC122256030 isoform X2 [Penaeus japonicus]
MQFILWRDIISDAENQDILFCLTSVCHACFLLFVFLLFIVILFMFIASFLCFSSFVFSSVVLFVCAANCVLGYVAYRLVTFLDETVPSSPSPFTTSADLFPSPLSPSSEPLTPWLSTPDAQPPVSPSPEPPTPWPSTPDAQPSVSPSPEPPTPWPSTPDAQAPVSPSPEPPTPWPSTPDAQAPVSPSPEPPTPWPSTPDAQPPVSPSPEPLTPWPSTPDAQPPVSPSPEPPTPWPSTPDAQPPVSPSPEPLTSRPSTMVKTLAELTDNFLGSFEGCAVIDVVDSFRREKPLHEMMSFLLRLPEAHRHLTPAECHPKNEKNAIAAEQFRSEGNSFYSTGRYGVALKMYSMSILLAPQPPGRSYPAAGEKDCDSSESGEFVPFSREEEEDEENQVLSLGYANRSAVLLEMKNVSKCLRDLNLALRFGYPKRLRFKLIVRWARCLILLGRDREALELLNTSLKALESLPHDELARVDAKVSLLVIRGMCKNTGPLPKGPSLSFRAPPFKEDMEIKIPRLKTPNRSIPALSNAVKLDYSRAKGRHLVAARNIYPGELLCSEKSFATVSQPGITNKCSNCLADYEHVIIPCPWCSEVRLGSLFFVFFFTLYLTQIHGDEGRCAQVYIYARAHMQS